jgi:uncharacterized membrane protein YbaN (DUF454 family)
MAMQILDNSPELTLIFDRWTIWQSGNQIRLLADALSQVEGVESVEALTVWYRKPQIRVVFGARTEPNAVLRKMATELRKCFSAPSQSPPPTIAAGDSSIVESRTAIVASPSDSGVLESDPDDSFAQSRRYDMWHRLREIGYGVLTIASFGMSWVGLVVPGIPTVPFVLLTAHFALKASPKLRARVLKSRMFGSMMRDWNEHRAIRRHVQIQAYAFTALIILVGFAFSPPIPILYVGMGVASAMGIYAIALIPVIESSPTDPSLGQTSAYLTSDPVVS